MRREFGGVCAYCGLPDPHLSPRRFHVDHYRPKGGPSAFPKLEHEYSNLFWSCELCNLFKGSYWPRLPGQLRIVNPCDDVLAEHFRLAGSSSAPAIEARTRRGAWTIEKLGMGLPAANDNRASFLLVCRALEDRRTAIKRDLRRARGLPSILAELRAQLRLVEAKIRIYSGADILPLPKRSRRSARKRTKNPR